jgi:hypothetical protein
MKLILALVLAALIPAFAGAEEVRIAPDTGFIQPSGERDLNEFLWINRPIVIFADSAADPRYSEQLDLLTERMDDLIARDVVVLTDTDPANPSPLRRKLRPRGFQLVLIGKDGGVKLRKPSPWSVRELTRIIDKMPDRLREMREQRRDG